MANEPYSFRPIPGWRKKRNEKTQLEKKERLLTLSIDLVKGHDVSDVQHYKERYGLRLVRSERLEQVEIRMSCCKLLFGSKPVEAEVWEEKCRR